MPATEIAAFKAWIDSGATKRPAFDIAGTVYPTAHEPIDCNGVPTSLGAKVVVAGKERAMTTPQTSGDRNGCHTEAGNNAPGRVMAP